MENEFQSFQCVRKYNLNFPLIQQLNIFFQLIVFKYFSEVIREVSELGGFIGERRMVGEGNGGAGGN